MCGAAIVGQHTLLTLTSPMRGIGQFALDEGFDLLAQGLAQPAAMILDAALLHASPLSKTHENIRKRAARLAP